MRSVARHPPCAEVHPRTMCIRPHLISSRTLLYMHIPPRARCGTTRGHKSCRRPSLDLHHLISLPAIFQRPVSALVSLFVSTPLASTGLKSYPSKLSVPLKIRRVYGIHVSHVQQYPEVAMAVVHHQVRIKVAIISDSCTDMDDLFDSVELTIMHAFAIAITTPV
ncbi:hypothetical protein BDV97DRAFT_347370 [Delphinella strobiligena]|nr:hypothetical protein BDV97DRAFT_347370 [Delphinella strobiligena]